MVADFGSKGGIPAVDGILNIAQDVREAELRLLLPGDGAVSGMDLGAPVRAEAVGDLANTTEGRISRPEMLLVAGTSRLIRKTKNFVRQALICLSSALPAGCANGACISRDSLRSAFAA